MTGSFRISVVVDSTDESEQARAAEAAALAAHCAAPGGASGRRVGRVDSYQRIPGSTTALAAERSTEPPDYAAGQLLQLPAPASTTVCKQDAVGVASDLGSVKTGLTSDSLTTDATLQMLTDCATTQ